MSDWIFLEKHRCVVAGPYVNEMHVSDSSYGFNGLFRFMLKGFMIRCIASDGMGWEHVSVTIEGDARPPKWHIMCAVKELFWDDEAWVVQFHPAKSEYVNHHPGCLHLWRPTDKKMPTPDSIMVGPKNT